MRALAIVALLLLAGCTNPSDSTPLAPTAVEAPDDSAPATNTTPAPVNETPVNQPPTATLSATGASGTAPLTTEFTLNGTDPDGDELTWSLDADGDGAADENGTKLPATVGFVYNDVGTFQANLTVSDGNATANAEITIVVAEVPPAGPTQVVDGEYAMPIEGCTVAYPFWLGGIDHGAAAGDELNGISRVQFDVDARTYRADFTVEWSYSVGYLYGAIAFLDAQNNILDGAATEPLDGEANLGSLSLDGLVPVNAVTAVMWTCGGPTDVSVHYEA